VCRNLLPIFGFNFVKYLTFRTKKQQLITLSRTVQSKDCTAASRMRFVYAPPRQHGPRSYPTCSLDSEHSRGKTLVFPWLRQFLVHKLSCQINFCKMTNLQLTLMSKFFLSASSLPRHNSSTDLPSELLSAPLVWVCQGGLAALRRPLRGPASRPPLLHHQSQVAGRGGCHQPPRQTAGLAPRGSCCNQEGLIFRPAGLFTFLFSGEEVFARPGPAAPSQTPQTRYPSRQQAPPQRLDL
jgi:hypothetical protein